MPKKLASSSSGQVNLNPNIFERAIMLLLFTLAVILFILFNLKALHYVLIPLPFIFDSKSLSMSTQIEPHYYQNAFLYSLFFVQHIVMASFAYKQAIISFVPRYYLYERYIYNIFSSWGYIMILDRVKPLSLQSAIVFRIPAIISVIFSIIGLVVLGISIFKLGGDIFNPFPIKRIIAGKTLNHPGYQGNSQQGLISTGIYSLCRHPMQGGVTLLFLFSSHIYTVDRLIFIGMNVTGIIIGVFMEEKRLCHKFKGYKDYQKKIRYRLLPYVI